jgi:hypothetical protein
MDKYQPNKTVTASVINTNCLKVDSAIIFLKLYPKLAPKPVINIVSPENTRRRRKIHNQSCFQADILLFLFDPEDGGDMLLRNGC